MRTILFFFKGVHESPRLPYINIDQKKEQREREREKKRDRERKREKRNNVLKKHSYIWSVAVAGEKRVSSPEQGLDVLEAADLELLRTPINHLLPAIHESSQNIVRAIFSKKIAYNSHLVIILKKK